MTRTVETLKEAIDIAKAGGDVMVRCPAHADNQASLHVKQGHTQPVVMTCHANCTLDEILEAGGIAQTDILAEGEQWDEKTRCIVVTGSLRQPKVWVQGVGKFADTIYDYTAEDGTLLYQVLRVQLPNGKTFRQRQPDEGSPTGWKWNMDGARRVLYQLPEVLAAKSKGETIWIVEGEKDVETLRSKGVTATTSPMGAGKWLPEYTQTLEGADIVIVADADATGRAHARGVREVLIDAGCTVVVKEAKSGCKDVTDHFNEGGTFEDLVVTTPGEQESKTTYGIDILDLVKRTVEPSSFVIPNVLARGDRFLLTGLEGQGKSLFCKQVSVQVAAGIHPWTGLDMPPQKVLVIDAENHPDQSTEQWSHLVGLAARHGHAIDSGMLSVIECWDDEIDLTGEAGRAWLMERVHAFRPDLLVIGPLYNMSEKDLTEHAVVGKLKSTINEARALYGSAVLMEHHSPHKAPGDTSRSVRPYGSSTFLKWPDFGFGLKPREDDDTVFDFVRTRGPRVRKRHFPEMFRHGKEESMEWPWTSCYEVDGKVY